MKLSLILAATLMPSVVVFLLLGLAILYVRMRRADRNDVVDLVSIQKPVTPEPSFDKRRSTEPFPQLPAMSLEPTGTLMDTSNQQVTGKHYGDFEDNQIVHKPQDEIPGTNIGHKRSHALTSTPKRFSGPTKSPTEDALAAFALPIDTPTKPPLPVRSLRRSSGQHFSPINKTPSIKVEPASSPDGLDLFASVSNPKPHHLTPTSLGRAHARQNIEASSSSSPTLPPARTNSSTKCPATPLYPFSAVPIKHIADPTSDDLPPTPATAASRTSRTYAYPYPTPEERETILRNPYAIPPFLPKDDTALAAMLANREMMEIEAWRPDLQARLAAENERSRKTRDHHRRILQRKSGGGFAGSLMDSMESSAEKAGGDGGEGVTSVKVDIGGTAKPPQQLHQVKRKKSGVSMHGKRNSAIRDYVRGFPEANPWRRMMGRASRDLRDLEAGVAIWDKKKTETGKETVAGEEEKKVQGGGDEKFKHEKPEKIEKAEDGNGHGEEEFMRRFGGTAKEI